MFNNAAETLLGKKDTKTQQMREEGVLLFHLSASDIDLKRVIVGKFHQSRDKIDLDHCIVVYVIYFFEVH